jgi:acyl-coenzyme A thioesterase PaaI-like protein
MDVTNIPFAKHIGIEYKEEGMLKLDATEVVQNHIQSIHASAQFTLAETQSGLHLQLSFPELVGKVVGVLRGATVKYKNPATTAIYAIANIEEKEKEKFLM